MDYLSEDKVGKMDVIISNSDIFSQVDDVKYIQIRDFSSVRDFQDDHIHFVRRIHFYEQLYTVNVYPNGISHENQEYVSVKVSKVLKFPDVIPDLGYDNITWTFSLLDINDHGRYYQSVAKASIVNLPYQIEIPKFLRRSFILERADELIPGDIITIHCEASYVFYLVQDLQDYLAFYVDSYHETETVTENFNEDSKLKRSSESDYVGLTEDLRANLSLNTFQKCDLIQSRRLYDTEEDITCYIQKMLNFLREYDDYKRRRLDPKDFELEIRLLSTILGNADDVDEIARTYMGTDPVFKVYIRLKLTVKDILGKNPTSIIEDQDLENEQCDYPLTYIRESYTRFRVSYSQMRRIIQVVKRLINSSKECENKDPLSTDEYKDLLKFFTELSVKNPMWKYLFEVMKSDESALSDDSDEEQDMRDSNCSKDTDWNFQIQTKEGVIF
ncbi:hypothetical protein AVEN_19618-1, partial [Araneus ventricosus]